MCRTYPRFVVSSLLLAAIATPLSLAASASVSDEIARKLESAFKPKLEAMALEKDAEGFLIKRPNLSRDFHAIADGKYITSLNVMTRDGDLMYAERFEVTFAPAAGSGFSVEKIESKGKIGGFSRFSYKNVTFQHFEKFKIEREGMTVTASDGTLASSIRDGRVERLAITAADLAYSYAPPSYVEPSMLNSYKTILARAEYKDIQSFPAETVAIGCDPISCKEMIDSSFSGIGPGKKEDLPPAVLHDFDEKARKQAVDRKANPFLGYEEAILPFVRTWSITALRISGKDRSFGLNYSNQDAFEITVFGRGSGGANFYRLLAYDSAETMKRMPDPYERELRADAEGREYHIKSVAGTIEMALDDPETVQADLSYTFEAKQDLEVLDFSLAALRLDERQTREESKSPTLTFDFIKDGDGNDLPYAQLSPTDGQIRLSPAIKSGQQFKLRLKFTNNAGIFKYSGSYSAIARGGFIPFLRFGDMVETMEFDIKVPERYHAIGIGEQISDSVEGGVRTSRWKADFPVSFATIIFGDYQAQTPSFALKKRDGTPIPMKIFVDRDSFNSISFPVRDGNGTIVDHVETPGPLITPKSMVPVADRGATALDYYTKIYDADYPFHELNLVNDPIGSYYGQSPASIIYLGWGDFVAEGAAGSGIGSQITKFIKDVVPHEVAHQWWGSLITNNNARSYWFVESMAEYSAGMWVEQYLGHKQFVEKVNDWRQEVLDADLLGTVQYYTAVDPGIGILVGRAFRAAPYAKGPLVINMLRTEFGNEKFLNFLRMCASELRGKRIITRDLQRIAERAFGGNMEWFFDQWIRGNGIPQYLVNCEYKQSEDGKWVAEGTVKQRVLLGKDKTPLSGTYFKAKVPFNFYLPGDKKAPAGVVVQGPETTFKIKLPQKPTRLEVNEDAEILAYPVQYGANWQD